MKIDKISIVVVIIGGGWGGWGSAKSLCEAGYKVTLFDGSIF